MVETRKARPRICSRYSRFATRKMLRIGLVSYGLDEDFFERGLNQFEAIDGGDGGGLVEEFLRVAVRVEANFGMAREVLGRLDFGAVEERGVAVELDDDAVALIPGFDLAHSSLENSAAPVHQAD